MHKHVSRGMICRVAQQPDARLFMRRSCDPEVHRAG